MASSEANLASQIAERGQQVQSFLSSSQSAHALALALTQLPAGASEDCKVLYHRMTPRYVSIASNTYRRNFHRPIIPTDKKL